MSPSDPYAMFYAKAAYRSAFEQVGQSALDMWHDRALYGRVDENQNSVFITNSNIGQKLKKLDTDEKGGLYCINFVADAFTALRNHIQKANATGHLSPTGLYSTLTPQSAYTSMETNFENHIDQYYNLFKKYLDALQRTNKIKTIHQFIEELMPFIKEYGADLPLTRTMYIKSRFFNPLSTGLMIDLYTVDANDDDKRKICVEDETFSFFQSAARKHGFYVVKHMPWRIVANISSTAMQRYFMSPEAQFFNEQGQPLGVPNYGLNYAPGSPTNLFGQRNRVPVKSITQVELNMSQYEDWKKGLVKEYIEDYIMTDLPPYYKKSYLTDIDTLKLSIAKMWNLLVYNEPVAIEESNCPGTTSYKKNFYTRKFIGTAIPGLLPPTSPTTDIQIPYLNRDMALDYFKEATIEKEWIKLYKDFLYYENNTNISPRRQKRLDNTVDKYYDVKGYSKTLDFINSYFKKIKGATANSKNCQTYTFCETEQQKLAAHSLFPSHVTVIKNIVSDAVPTSGGGGSSGGSGRGY